jgi:hypothetical protein
MIGERFKRLSVLAFDHVDGNRHTHWLCRCDCGTEITARTTDLRSGNSASCGCLRRDVGKVVNRKHGQKGSGAYSSWQAMRARCRNPRAKNYPRYGGRGIEDRYPSFEAFHADMGERPPDHDIHRLDTHGHYEPGNCVWLQHVEHTRLHNRA